MDRDIALKELTLRLKNSNLIKHSLAVEAIMKETALYLKEDVDNWALAGLLHDIDYDITVDTPEKHSVIGAEILSDLGLDESIIYSVKSHNSHHGIKRKRKMDKALYAADPLSGLIIASALILPNKNLDELTIRFLMKKFNELSFAKGANRGQIKECEDLGISLEKFMEISLSAIKKISQELGL